MYRIKDHQEPQNVSQAVSLLDQNPGMVVIAGGTDVLIKMHAGKLQDVSILSLRSIHGLDRIEMTNDGTLHIGPMATFSQINQSSLLNEQIPVLSKAAITMGGPQIRNVATIGGNICNGATSADSASTLFALNAQLYLESVRGTRIVPIEEFYLGPGRVDLKGDEILVDIQIEAKDYQGFCGKYIKFAVRNAMDIATLGVAAVCMVNDEGVIENLRIGLGVAGPTPRRCHDAENYAIGKKVTQEILEEIGRRAMLSTQARTSWRASKEYREHLVKTLSQRAIKEAIAEFGGTHC
ncbi:xanthine dehydrogenase FAD-binding subunit XdhB [Clostridia bacterium]|nr:xanthine dehydrogenase FAD-binding subunit XdhB [Clostridia bacterium]